MSTKIGQFLGTELTKLKNGAIIHGPFEQTGAFIVDETTNENIPFGTLLAYGSGQKKYTALKGTDAVTKFAGIALIEQAMAPNVYPGTAAEYKPGQVGNVLLVGDAGVPFSTESGNDITNVVEGGLVYLQADGKVGDKVVAEKQIANLIFTGHVEGNTVGVKKLY